MLTTPRTPLPMARLSAKLRSVEGGAVMHWCPGCDEAHIIPVADHRPVRWAWDGDVEAPSFDPSLRHTGKRKLIVDGEWVGGWVLGPDGVALDGCCHYFLKAGVIVFLDDSTHHLRGQTVPLPDIPILREV